MLSPHPSRGGSSGKKGARGSQRGRLVGLNEGRSTELGRVWEVVSPSRLSKFFLNKHVKEALIEHPTTRNDGMEDPTTSSDGTVCW